MELIYKPKKSLGQNFLIDRNIIKKIVEIENINKNTKILEIGPGYGNLTKVLISKKPKKIIAVEKDKQISSFLKNLLKDYKNVLIDNSDILISLKNNFGNNVIVFGNLPYNISTQILASLILLKKWPPWYKSLIFMFQKEVADRIIAKSNSKDFGRLSILCNWRLEIKKHFDVSKNCFFPKPKINSTILTFKPKIKNKYHLNNPKNLETITRVLFSNRRKKINKNFSKLFQNNLFVAKELNLDLNKRAEELNNEMFYKIAIMYEKTT
jgi:16S rRNA (adenine1518-N6/adenine1519-N6)-dimethyltransferase